MNFADPKAVSEKIRSSKKILLVTHSRPSVDAVASLSVIYDLLKVYYKKDVDIANTFTLTPRFKDIMAKVNLPTDKMVADVPQKTYVIKIKKQGEKIESINFNEEGDTFNFVITPFSGSLDINNVAVEEAGNSYDLIITVDTASLSFIGDFYKKNESIFSNIPIISFDNHKSNSGFALYSVGQDEIDTTSQAILGYMQSLQIPLREVDANLLFTGIQSFLFLGLKSSVRPSVYTALATLTSNKADALVVHDLLYGVSSLNEIFLVGDILDSSNEGTIGEDDDRIKVIGCKIALNKEELNLIDMDKTVQVILWNIHNSEYKLSYVIFQRSAIESVAYFYTYGSGLSIKDHIKNLNGKSDKAFARVDFAMDMNSADKQIIDEFKIVTVRQENKFGIDSNLPPMDDFDFGDDTFAPPLIQNAPAVDNTLPLFPSPSNVPSPSSEPTDPDSKPDDKPKMFDPRTGV